MRGTLTSPNYPDFYPPHVNSTETIQVRKGNVIKLQFRYFQTESSLDYLWITEDGVGHLTYKMHGSDVGRPVVSRTETVHVHFRANSGRYWRSYRSGWRIEWMEIAPECSSNSTTLFSDCPRGMTTPIKSRHWLNNPKRSWRTCKEKLGQLVGIESAERNCLACLSCEGGEARQERG